MYAWSIYRFSTLFQYFICLPLGQYGCRNCSKIKPISRRTNIFDFMPPPWTPRSVLVRLLVIHINFRIRLASSTEYTVRILLQLHWTYRPFWKDLYLYNIVYFCSWTWCISLFRSLIFQTCFYGFLNKDLTKLLLDLLLTISLFCCSFKWHCFKSRFF